MVGAAGEPVYRAQQIFHALYSERVPSLDQATSLSKEFRAALGAAGVSVGMPSIQKRFLSSDGTVRYLIELSDSETVETVWMPEGDEGETGDGSEAGEELAVPDLLEIRKTLPGLEANHDLRFQPGRLRGQLPILSNRSPRREAEPDRR